MSTEPFAMTIVPRYSEVDQQGVVFNGHYLTWFDEASTAFFDHIGLPFTVFTSWGMDVRVVHTELDYLTPIRWRDSVHVTASVEAMGTTSFTLGFEALRRQEDGGYEVAVRGRTVYVVMSTVDWTKREIPNDLRSALTSVAGQGQNAVDDGIENGTVGP